VTPQVPGLFYDSKLQVSIVWWKMPQHFTSKKVLRWVDHGVKVEFHKGLPFTPKPSMSKFVDPQDVEFAIKDLLKGRHIGKSRTWFREVNNSSPDTGFTLLREG